MRVAGAQSDVFTEGAMRRMYKLSGGIPRLINVIADRSLLAAYTQEQRRVGSGLVRRAANEVFGRRAGGRWWPWVAVTGSLAMLALLTASVVERGQQDDQLVVAELDVTSPSDAPPRLGFDGDGADFSADAVSGAVAAAVGPLVPLQELLSDPALPMDSVSASSELFRHWQIEYQPGAGPVCDQAATFQLRCLSLPGSSIRDLRRLNRPAVLLLPDDEGRDRQLVISRIGYDFVELSAGSHSSRVDIAELTHYWYGDLWLLWKPVLGTGEVLSPGDRSELVPWLRERLGALVGPYPPVEDPLLYDEALVDSVRLYQAENRLVVDGVVGAQTQIALQTDLDGSDVPRIVEAL